MPNNNENTTHWLLGGSLLLVALLATAIVFIKSQADTTTVTTSTEITNSPPVVDSVYFSSTDDNFLSNSFSSDLTPGTTTRMYITGIVHDDNSETDINNLYATFYRSSQTCTEVGHADENYCYYVATSSCVIDATGGTPLDANYYCPIDLSYYTDSTEAGGEFPSEHWVGFVQVEDDSGATGSLEASTTINTLLALNVPSTGINYGDLGTGATSSDLVITLTQQGNDRADVELSGTDMICDGDGSDNIGVGQQAWAIATATPHSSKTPFTTSSTPANIDVSYRTDDEVSKDLYWSIQIPSFGVRGTCTGTNTITVAPQL